MQSKIFLRRKIPVSDSSYLHITTELKMLSGNFTSEQDFLASR